MNTEPEVARIVRSWLEDGVDRAPERILDAALERVPTTPQRRPGWPVRRFPQMPILLRLAAVTAAVIVVAFGATMLLSDRGEVGVPTPAPTLTPSPAATTPASPVPSGGPLGAADIGRSLTIGTYEVGDPFGAPFTITFPFGWKVTDIADGKAVFDRPTREDPGVWRASVDVALVTNVFDDPCLADAPRNPPVAATVDDVVAAISDMAGFTATAATDVTVGDVDGKAFEISNAIDLTTAGCVDGRQLRLFTVSGDGADAVVAKSGDQELVWVLDVDGSVVVILGEPIASPELPALQFRNRTLTAIREVVGSIVFE